MAVTSKVYHKAITSVFNEEVDWAADTIKVMLLSAYTPSQANHQYHSDVVGAGTEVANGNGYTTGGATLTDKTEAFASNVKQFDAADVVWSTSTITAAYAVVYDSTPGSSATNPVLCYVDFDGNVSSSGGNFTIAWDSTGVFTVTVS